MASKSRKKTENKQKVTLTQTMFGEGYLQKVPLLTPDFWGGLPNFGNPPHPKQDFGEGYRHPLPEILGRVTTKK